MKKIYSIIISALLTAMGAHVSAQIPHMTNRVPECHVIEGHYFPEKYIKLAKRHKEFSWTLKVSGNTRDVSGNGWERIDGSSLFNAFLFSRIDVNNDGNCDWYVTALAPLSTGGDRDILNTIYLSQKNGWSRIGASIPDDMPDELGAGKSTTEQKHYLFGEDIAVIHDLADNINYLITAFYERDIQRDGKPGYRIFAWDKRIRTLALLDKWEPGSKAAAVYAYFKSNGASSTTISGKVGDDGIDRFDPAIEAFELQQACNPDSPQRTFPENSAPVSPYLLARCNRQH